MKHRPILAEIDTENSQNKTIYKVILEMEMSAKQISVIPIVFYQGFRVISNTEIPTNG